MTAKSHTIGQQQDDPRPMSDWQRERTAPALKPLSFGDGRRFRVEVAVTMLIVLAVVIFIVGRSA